MPSRARRLVAAARALAPRPCLACGQERPKSRPYTCSAACSKQMAVEKLARHDAGATARLGARRAVDPVWQAKLAWHARNKAKREQHRTRAEYLAQLAERRRLRIEKAKAERQQKRAERRRIKELRLKYSHLKFDLFPKPQQQEPKPRFASTDRWDGDIDALIG